MAVTAEPRFRQGAGRLCLDLVRTLRYRDTVAATDELSDPEALAEWLRQLGPVACTEAPTSDQLREARRLREAVHELVTAAVRGEVCRASARERVNRAALAPVPVPRLVPSGQILWQADDPVAAVMAVVARDALDLVTSPAVGRVRECAGETCGAWFLDASRPGSRRWCSMTGCGNLAKKKTMRAKA
jgi:predicted RNA-binding Zn ribbon-like protein